MPPSRAVPLSAEEQGYKLENATLEYLGTAEKIIIDKDNTTIVNGKGEKDGHYQPHRPD